METGVTSYAGSAIRHTFLSRPRTTTHSWLPSQQRSSRKSSLKSANFFGESLRVESKSISRTANRNSFTTKCEIGDSLEEFLNRATPDKKLIRLLVSMGEALRTISFKVRTASCSGTACVNFFGDEQLTVDVLADKLLFESLRYSHVCKYACSEEVPELQDMDGPAEGMYH